MHRNFIGGEWVAGVATRDNVNPSDLADVIGAYAEADETQASAACDAASAAFAAWSTSGVQPRADALERVAAELLARRAELGDLLAREEGKTLPEATAEVMRARQIFRFFAGEALRVAGERLPSVRAGVDVEVTREPVGVVGNAISFTGSSATGARVMAGTAKRFAKVQLEMGGKNPWWCWTMPTWPPPWSAPRKVRTTQPASAAPRATGSSCNAASSAASTPRCANGSRRW